MGRNTISSVVKRAIDCGTRQRRSPLRSDWAPTAHRRLAGRPAAGSRRRCSVCITRKLRALRLQDDVVLRRKVAEGDALRAGERMDFWCITRGFTVYTQPGEFAAQGVLGGNASIQADVRRAIEEGSDLQGRILSCTVIFTAGASFRYAASKSARRPRRMEPVAPISRVPTRPAPIERTRLPPV